MPGMVPGAAPAVKVRDGPLHVPRRIAYDLGGSAVLFVRSIPSDRFRQAKRRASLRGRAASFFQACAAIGASPARCGGSRSASARGGPSRFGPFKSARWSLEVRSGA